MLRQRGDAEGGEPAGVPPAQHSGERAGWQAKVDAATRRSLTVNVQEATYDNSIGAPFLQAYWKDPDFDSSQCAFYYVRVLEIPTLRWTTYDAIFGVKLPEDVPASIQERAYTSPIWYTPKV